MRNIESFKYELLLFANRDIMCNRCGVELPFGENGEPHTLDECPFPENPPDNTPIISADWEGGDIGWRLVRFDENGINETNQGIGREDILDASLWDNERITLIIETAHLQPRSNPPKSKAQIFTNKELQSLEDSLKNSGSKAYAFPNNRCKIAKHLAGYGDDKTLDPYAQILFYLNYAQGQEIPHPRSIDLKRWRIKSLHSRAMDLLSDQVRIDMTVRLNSFRAIHAHEDSPQDYDTTEFPHDEVRNAIQMVENILKLDLLCDENDVDLDEEVKEYFNLSGENLEDLIGTDSVMRLMTLYVCVFNEDGSVRTHESMLGQIPTQLINRFEQIEGQEFPLSTSTNPIGLRFIWDRLLLMTPYKGKTGGQFTARANMMYRGLRNYDHSNITDEEFRMKPCPVPSCHAGEGDQCTLPNGTLRADGMHVKRKSVHWNEPAKLWILRQANRQRWRKIQKTMLRALIQVGSANERNIH